MTATGASRPGPTRTGWVCRRCDFSSTAGSAGRGFPLEPAYVRGRHAAVQLEIRTGALEISPREAGDRDGTDEHDVRDRPESQRRPALLGAAERAEPEQEARQSRRLLRDRAQRVLVARFERNRPRGDLRGVGQPRRVEHVTDVPEEPGDET